jgi:hypothetical protein
VRTSPRLKIPRVLVRLGHVDQPHHKRESQHHVTGCKNSAWSIHLRSISSERRRGNRPFDCPVGYRDYNNAARTLLTWQHTARACAKRRANGSSTFSLAESVTTLSPSRSARLTLAFRVAVARPAMRPACHKFNADLPLLGTDTKTFMPERVDRGRESQLQYIALPASIQCQESYFCQQK